MPKTKKVAAAIISRHDQVLICQRSEFQPHPLKWEFPGGKIEAGEMPEQALARELEEELGIAAVIGGKVATIQHSYGPDSSVVLHFYSVTEFQGEIQNRIFRDVRWVLRQELFQFDFLEADTKLVQDIASGLKLR